MIEPNCELPWELYKDWLYEFNDNDDLRNIDLGIFCVGFFDFSYHSFYIDNESLGNGGFHDGNGINPDEFTFTVWRYAYFDLEDIRGDDLSEFNNEIIRGCGTI